MIVDLVSLALGASFDVFLYILSHIWPPIVLGNQLCCSIDYWMSVHGGIVVCSDNGSFVMLAPSDHLSSLFVPEAFYLLEFVGVDPQAQYVFILLIDGLVLGHIFCCECVL
jgi:hypothetical protein